MKFILLLALRSLLRNPRRTFIALATVAFGVAGLITAGGFVDALLIKLREDTIHSQLGHIQIQDARSAESGLSRPYAYLLPSDDASVASIARVPGVRMVTSRLPVNGLISFGETTLSFTGQGIEPSKEAALAHGLLVSGTRLNDADENAVVLGGGLAHNLGVNVGDKVVLLATAANGSLNAAEMTVRGTFASISKAYDDFALRLPLAAAERLVRVRSAQQLLVLLDDTGKTADAAQRIRNLLGSRYAITRWDDEADFYRKTADLFSRQFGFIRFVIMAIIVLSILNTMTMNVLERRWEVGVMLSLGDPRRCVLALFALEGAVLGATGSVAGVLIGVVLAVAANRIGIPMPAPPGMSHGFNAGISLSSPLIATACAIGIGATIVAALPPSLRASRMRVIEALRTGQ